MARNKDTQGEKNAKEVTRVAKQKQADRDATGRNPDRPVAGSQAWADKQKKEGK
jgi:hypothetical protein